MQLDALEQTKETRAIRVFEYANERERQISFDRVVVLRTACCGFCRYLCSPSFPHSEPKWYTVRSFVLCTGTHT